MGEEYLRFYEGEGTYEKYTISEIFQFNYKKLNTDFKYIYLLFPYDEPSKEWKDAPIINKVEIDYMLSNKRCQENMKKAFEMMMLFFGYVDEDNMLINITEKKRWVKNEKNLKKITRILQSLKLFGKERERTIFFVSLFTLYKLNDYREYLEKEFRKWLLIFDENLYEKLGKRRVYVREYKKSSFTSVREIYDGMIGKIYVAIDKKTNKKVILKELDTTRKNFHEKSAYREIFITNSLYHPNIVELLGTFSNGVYTYLVLEYASKGNLSDYANKKGNFDFSNYVPILLNIVSALKYALKCGIVHRDLKLENVVITDKDVAKITDFGLSLSIFSSEKLCASRVGTLHYTAPEMIKNRFGECSYKIDVWSLGVMIYNLYFDNFPFELTETEKKSLVFRQGENRKNKEKDLLREKITSGVFFVPRTMKNGEYTPEILSELLLKMLSIIPEKRPNYDEIEESLRNMT